VPVTSEAGLFAELCGLGKQLAALHLMEDTGLEKTFTNFPVKGSNQIERGFPVHYPPGMRPPKSDSPTDVGRVYINSDQYFNDVPPEVWEFYIGGYQVCRKWLQDRQERTLSYDEVEHYKKTVKSISETIRLMASIDDTIQSFPLD